MRHLPNKQRFITFVESNKESINMLNKKEKEELKALIEEEEEFLRFFALYEKEFKQDESEREWAVAVDDCLDILSPLYQQLDERKVNSPKGDGL